MMAAPDAPGAIKQNHSLKIDTSKPVLPSLPLASVPPVAAVNMDEMAVPPQDGEIDPALYYGANGYPGAQYMYAEYNMGYAESPGVSSEQWQDYIRMMGMDDVQTPQGYSYPSQQQFYQPAAPTVGPDGQLYGHPMAFQYPGQMYQQQGPQAGGMGPYVPPMNGAPGALNEGAAADGDFGRGNNREGQASDGRSGRPGGNAPQQSGQQQQPQQQQAGQQAQQQGAQLTGRAGTVNGVGSAQDVRFSNSGGGQWQEAPAGVTAMQQQRQPASQQQHGPASQGAPRGSGAQGGVGNRNAATAQQVYGNNGNAGGMPHSGGPTNNHHAGYHAQGNRGAPSGYNRGRGANGPLMPYHDMGWQGGRGVNGWGMYGGDRGGRGGRGGRGIMQHGGGYMGNGMPRHDASSELNRGPRFARLQDGNKVSAPLPSGLDASLYNRADFQTKYEKARFFVIKSYSEDDVHKSIKYNVWASTPGGNKRLEAAYKEAQATAAAMPKGEGTEAKCPVFLFYSVNASGRFCGCAEMTGPVDHSKSVDYWQQDKWMGQLPVKWHIVKDVLNGQLRHIVLANNDNKPVTNSRDTQEIPFEQGLEMLEIFKAYNAKSSLLDDFTFYDGRQKTMEEKRNPSAKTAPGEMPSSSLTDAVTAAAASLSLGGAESKSNGGATTAGDTVKGSRPSSSGPSAAAPAPGKSDGSNAPAVTADLPAGPATTSASASAEGKLPQQAANAPQPPNVTGSGEAPTTAATSAPAASAPASKDAAPPAKALANGVHAPSGSPSKDDKKGGQPKQQQKGSQPRQTSGGQEKAKGNPSVPANGRTSAPSPSSSGSSSSSTGAATASVDASLNAGKAERTKQGAAKKA